MPRLSLYKPEKGNDYKFVDRQASEMFQAGGTDVYVHKLLGANTSAQNATADQPNYSTLSPTNIQDLLLLENRDRKYDKEVYRIRGLYNVQNIDFNLSQFGLFIDNDTLYMTVHINDFIKYIGRKPISGDVMELPHLRDDFALNDFDMSLPRYYVIEDVGRASEGFSQTWFPHLYRLKLKRVTDNQQFADIFNQPALDANGDPVANTTLKDLLSTYNTEININNQLIQQAEADAPKSGYETRQFYTLAADPTTGKSLLTTADESTILASSAGKSVLASAEDAVPKRTGYQGFLVGDGVPPNGYDFGFGIQFPSAPAADDFFLRVDYLPNRLFRYDGVLSAWIAVEDAVRMTMTNNDTRQTQKTSFINNTAWLYNDSLASGAVNANGGETILQTIIPYPAPETAAYLVIKQSVITLEYVIGDHPTLFSTYNYTNWLNDTTSPCIQINLPVVDSEQQTIPYPGTWTITLYSTREAQRQAVSKALKPKADF
jgi:hypothetical protein